MIHSSIPYNAVLLDCNWILGISRIYGFVFHIPPFASLLPPSASTRPVRYSSSTAFCTLHSFCGSCCSWHTFPNLPVRLTSSSENPNTRACTAKATAYKPCSIHALDTACPIMYRLILEHSLFRTFIVSTGNGTGMNEKQMLHHLDDKKSAVAV